MQQMQSTKIGGKNFDMKGIVDRIEGDTVVCEMNGKEMIELNISVFSISPKDGDVFDYDGSTAVVVNEETEAKKQRVQSLFDRLKKK